MVPHFIITFLLSETVEINNMIQNKVSMQKNMQKRSKVAL